MAEVIEELRKLAEEMETNFLVEGSIGPLHSAGFALGSQVSAQMLYTFIEELENA